jgi:hypothetical protein
MENGKNYRNRLEQKFDNQHGIASRQLLVASRDRQKKNYTII